MTAARPDSIAPIPCGNSPLKVLYGTVADQNNIPVANTKVFLMQYDILLNALKPIDDTKTDATGQYSFATTASQLYVHVVPNPSAYPNVMPAYQNTTWVQQNAPAITMNASSIQKNIICTNGLPNNGNVSLSGVVTKENGQNTSAVRLFLMQNNLPVATTVISFNGSFSFSNLAPGTYTIWVDRMGIVNNVAPAITLTTGGFNAAFVLHPTWLELLTTGIAENKTHTAFKLYPNPATNTINYIWANETELNAQIEIVDLLGTKLLSQNIIVGNGSIDVSELNSGIYLIQVKTDSKSWQQKLCIQK